MRGPFSAAGTRDGARSYLPALVTWRHCERIQFLSGEPQQYVGHNPLARIGVSLLFLLLLVQAVTGLVIAGTDLFWPPFGHWFATWVAAPGIDPATIVPGAKELIDQASYDSMRAFRRPFVEVHETGFYALAV